MASKTRPNGFTFVEILVALLVLSVGLLGLASLQVSGIRNNHSAYLRSQAVMLAQDMADRMRANQAAAEAEQFVFSSAGDFSSDGRHCEQTLSASDPSCTTGCTTEELAERAAFEWKAMIVGELPSGRGCLCLDSDPGDNIGCDTDDQPLYTVTVSWDESNSGAATSTIKLRVQP